MLSVPDTDPVNTSSTTASPSYMVHQSACIWNIPGTDGLSSWGCSDENTEGEKWVSAPLTPTCTSPRSLRTSGEGLEPELWLLCSSSGSAPFRCTRLPARAAGRVNSEQSEVHTCLQPSQRKVFQVISTHTFSLWHLKCSYHSKECNISSLQNCFPLWISACI